MPEATRNKKVDDLIDVGEEQGAEINLDDKGEPEKVEVTCRRRNRSRKS